MKSNSIEIKRNELYEKVWSKPMAKLALDYELSDNGLAKICKKLDIHRPEIGYLSKLAVGNNVNKKPIPPLKEDKPSEYEFSNIETKEKGDDDSTYINEDALYE